MHTLGSSDLINGGEGTDRMNLKLAGTFVAGPPAVSTIQTVVPNMMSVEQIYVQALGSGAGAPANGINMINVTGTQELWNNNSTNDLEITNVQEKATLGVIKGNGSDFTVQYDNAVVEGEQDIVLDDADVGTLRVDDGLADGFATVNIDATAGFSDVTELRTGSVSGSVLGDLTTLNITGAGELWIRNALDAVVKTIDASTNTGGVDLDVTASTQNVTFTGGDGDDRIAFGTYNPARTETLTLNDKVDGGDGRDTLAVADQATIVAGLQVSNVEILELNTLDGTLEAARIAGVDEVRVTSDLDNATGVAIVNGLSSNSTFVTEDSGDVRLNITNAQVAGTNDTLNLHTDIAGVGGLDVMAAGVETIAYTQDNLEGAGADTTVWFYDTDGVIDMSTLTIASNDGNVARFNGLVNTIKTVNAAAAEGDVEVSIAGGNPTNGVSITGGSGDDFLMGGDGKDVIVGGAGDDDISGDGFFVIPGTGGAPIAQVSTLTIANEGIGDSFSIDVNGNTYTVVSTTGADATTLLAAAIAAGEPTLQSVAPTSATVITLTGAVDGTAFLLSNPATTNFAGTPAAAEVSTVTIDAAYIPDADDAIGFDINGVTFAGTAGQSVANQVATIVAAINAAGQMTAASAIDPGTGDTVITLTGISDALDYVIDNESLGVNAAVAAVKQVDTIVLDDGAGGNADLTPGNIIQVTINGTTVNYTITGTAATDANGLVSAIDAAGLGVKAAFVDAGVVGLVIDDGDSLTLTADTAGIPFTATLQVNGAAPSEMSISTTTANVVATTTQVPGTVITISDQLPTPAVPAGADTQTIVDATTTQGQQTDDQYFGFAAASDALTGGAGNDTFWFISGSGGWDGTKLTTMDTITDLNLGGATAILGVDTITLNAAFFNAAAIDVNGNFVATSLINAGTPLAMTGPTFEAGLQALYNAGGALSGATDKVGLFTYGSDTYLIAADATVGLGVDDHVIKVTGVTGTLDLSDVVLV